MSHPPAMSFDEFAATLMSWLDEAVAAALVWVAQNVRYDHPNPVTQYGITTQAVYAPECIGLPGSTLDARSAVRSATLGMLLDTAQRLVGARTYRPSRRAQMPWERLRGELWALEAGLTPDQVRELMRRVLERTRDARPRRTAS